MVKIFDLVINPLSHTDLPDPDAPYYIAAKQGLYIHKKGPLGTALIPTKELPPNLNPIPTEHEKGLFTYSAQKLPVDILSTAITFFRDVLTKHDAEAEVLILLNDKLDIDKDRYSLYCPYQRVSGASVHSLYDPTTLPSGYQAIGSIHSHCNMSAFHSGTDTDDASDFPGLHITIGTLNTTATFAAMVMLNGVRFDYDIETVAETGPTSEFSFPKHWLERVVTNGEHDRAKILAETINNVSDEDKKKFLGTYQPPIKHWGNLGGGNGQMWSEYGMDWKSTNVPKPDKPSKRKKGSQKNYGWSSELRTNLPGDLLDKVTGEFQGVDEAIEGMAIVLDRLRAVTLTWGLELGYEISDAQTGSTILWTIPGDDDDALLPTTTTTAE